MKSMLGPGNIVILFCLAIVLYGRLKVMIGGTRVNASVIEYIKTRGSYHRAIYKMFVEFEFQGVRYEKKVNNIHFVPWRRIGSPISVFYNENHPQTVVSNSAFDIIIFIILILSTLLEVIRFFVI